MAHAVIAFILVRKASRWRSYEDKLEQNVKALQANFKVPMMQKSENTKLQYRAVSVEGIVEQYLMTVNRNV